MTALLRIEELEERIAPTAVAPGASLSFTDADGDQVKVWYFGSAGSSLEVTDALGGAMGNGDLIGWLTVSAADWSSRIVVESLGGGDGTIDILSGVRSTTAGADLGSVILGFGLDGDAAGTVNLGSGAQITSLGGIGAVIINGDIDFDAGGHAVDAAGDIGLVDVRGDMALDPTDGALIDAGASGAGNVSFIAVGGDITIGTAGAALAAQVLNGTLVIADDAGTGSTGSLRITGSGSVTAIPVVGGGNAVSSVDVTAGSSLSIAAVGTGDVAEVTSAGAIGSVNISGAADTDVYRVSASSVGSVVNSSSGGDIVGVVSAGAVGTVQTGATGIVGSSFTGAGNRTPLVIGDSAMSAGVSAGGDIAAVRTGTLYSAGVEGGSLALLSAAPGGIVGSTIDLTGSLASAAAAYIFDSDINADAGIGSVKVGGNGITDSVISTSGTLASLVTTGSIVESDINLVVNDGADHFSGGYLASLSAASVYGSDISAFQGFGKIQIRGAFVNSVLDTRFTDAAAGEVGGSVASFSAGSMVDGRDDGGIIPMIQAHGNITSLKVGAGGMLDNAIADASGSIVSATVMGDLSRSSYIVAGSGGIGLLKVTGDLAYNSRISSTGAVGSVQIGGQIIGGDIIFAGDVARFSVKGGINGRGVSIGIGGNVALFDVSGGICGTVLNVVAPANGVFIDLEGDVAAFRVKGDVAGAYLQFGEEGAPIAVGRLDVYGSWSSSVLDAWANIGALSVKGAMMEGQLTVEGDVSAVSIGRGMAYTYLSIRGDAQTSSFTVGRSVENSQTIFYGGIASYSVRGSMHDSAVTTCHYDGGGNPLGGAIGALSANEIINGTIAATGGITSVTAKGSIFGTTIEAVGRDNSGTGAITAGGSIGAISAKGLENAAILAYAHINSMSVGDEGLGHLTTVETVTGNLGSITSRGLIFGDIEIAGAVTGSILSTGADAVQIGGSDVYNFVDANGTLTGGTLTAVGGVSGVVS